jgi:sugar phosphate isomerase/epimerase
MKKKNPKIDGFTRRQFIGRSAAVTAGITFGSNAIFGAPAFIKNLGKPNSLINGVQIGAITYSFRSMPDQSAEATLQYVLDSGISAIELMGEPAESFAGAPVSTVDRSKYYGLMRKTRDGGTLTAEEQKEFDELKALSESYENQLAAWRTSVSMDKFIKLKKMYADAGVSIYAFKPSTFGPDSSDAVINYGLNAAKALGANQVTLEFPDNNERTKKLGDMGAKHKIYFAYHGHEQQTPTMWDIALSQSKYNAMNLDVGHYVAAGNPSPIDLIIEKHDRIKSMHLKDRQNPSHEKGNLMWGKGDTPIVEILHLIRDNKYKFPATVELEYEVPEGSNAVKEVKKCVDYCRKALED